MEILTSTILTPRRAHVFSLGDEIGKARVIWLIAHGYGQPADRIIRKFDHLNLEYHYLVAPEGLSVFYWKGMNQQPVPSWMTSRFRLDEIDDYCDYLDKVYLEIKSKNRTAKVIFLGFSQGATTLYRWIHARKPNFEAFINYAGWFPEDIDMKNVSTLLKDKHFLVLGKNDPYLTDERKNFMSEVMKKALCTPEIFENHGEHKIERDSINKIIKRIAL